jgi:hypothetical protein
MPRSPDYSGRIIEKGEANTTLVREIAERLRARGYASLSLDAVFDANLAATVKLFQSQHVDRLRRPLKIDGRVGPLTWGALFGAVVDGQQATGLAAAALEVAGHEVGVMEDPPGSNCGERVNEYLACVDTPPGNYWCMAFVNFCFQQGAKAADLRNAFPRTASCLDAWNTVRREMSDRILRKADAQADPSLVKPGYVFILDHGGGLGHTGFVSNQLSGALRTIEGNSNTDGSDNGVGVFALNRRSVLDKELKGFLIFDS